MAPSLPGLYLHVPFCWKVCPYCDFAVQAGGPKRRAGYVRALLAEIELWGREPRLADWSFDTLYLGGGTPSALPPETLAEILGALRRHLPVAPDARTFFEANPEDVNRDSLDAWRRLGVETLSLGVQSFDEAALAFLGRRHGPEQARESVRLALEAGFSTVSLDLIYGLPGQAPEAWRRQLDTAVALAPDHLSCYQLTVHTGTWFGKLAARGELAEMPEPEQAELFFLTHRRLAEAGYPAYEVSNFARAPEHRSRHNAKYWDHTPYLGLGPSAHSFGGLSHPTSPSSASGGQEGGRRDASRTERNVSERGRGPGESEFEHRPQTHPAGLQGHRWWNERTLTRYMERLEAGELPVVGSEELGVEELALEALALALRTPQGIGLDELRRRYGFEPAPQAVARWLESGHLRDEPGRLCPTLAGLAVADTLAAELAAGS